MLNNKYIDKIDSSVGIVLRKKIGDNVQIGDVLCTLYLKEGAEPISDDITDYYTFQEFDTNRNVSSPVEEEILWGG